MDKKKVISFRKYNVLFHRYVGYFFSTLIIAYCISGVAVNHIDSWNPNYVITRNTINIPSDINSENFSEKEAKLIFDNLGIKEDPNKNNIFFNSDINIDILLSENESVKIDLSKNEAVHEKIKRRPFLYYFNFLHLNNPKKLWTYYADFFAISLLLITISGLIMKKGKEGFFYKGLIFSTLGMVIPIILLVLYQ